MASLINPVSNNFRTLNVKDFIVFFIVGLLAIKFLVIRVFDSQNIFIDLLFYAFVGLSLSFVPLNRPTILILLIGVIGVVSPSARNLFIVLYSSYVIARELSLRDAAFLNVVMVTTVICLVLLFNHLGYISNHDFTGGIYIGGAVRNIRVRSDFGFGNPNVLALICFSLFINLFLVLKKNYRKLLLVLSVLPVYWIYSITGSRTFIACFVVFYLAYFAISFPAVMRFILKTRWLIAIFPILFIFLILIIARVDFQNMMIEILTSGRLSLYKSLIKECGLKGYLIGTGLINEMTIDNSYLHLMFSAGIYGFIVSMYIWIKGVMRQNKENVYLMPILVSYLLYGTMESVWTNILCFGNLILWVILMKSSLLNYSLKES